MKHPELEEHGIEEMLETIWARREDGRDDLAGLVTAGNQGRAILDSLVEEGAVVVDGDRVRLGADGEERARRVVRRNRLAERLLSDVLDIPLAEAEESACLMEHVLNRSVTNAVCTFLGHPPTCPHGRPIPPGACCRRGVELGPVVVPVTEMRPGTSGRILFLAPGFQKRMQKLASYGVVPGTDIRLVQRRPSYVLEVGGTTLALDGDAAKDIFVRSAPRGLDSEG